MLSLDQSLKQLTEHLIALKSQAEQVSGDLSALRQEKDEIVQQIQDADQQTGILDQDQDRRVDDDDDQEPQPFDL